MPSTLEITDRVLRRCRELGFALAGVCDAAPTDYKQEFLAWLAAGKHGEMEYLSRNIELRIDPGALMPGAKSVICVADRYGANAETPKRRNAETFDAPLGKIARYTRGDDYHVVMKKRLGVLCNELSSMFPGETFRACVDTAPVMERELAQRAGLGAIGKNTLVIERGVGSYLLLGEIVTTMSLASSPPAEPDPCGGCTRCIEACPTQAISPWSVDATRCISYLTIEHRSEIDPQFHEAMGDWIFGCDVCQDVCPHNQPTSRSQQAPVHAAYAPRRDGFDLLDVLKWDEQARRGAFVKSAMKRAKFTMMKRNAMIAAGNVIRRASNPALSGQIAAAAVADAEGAMVRATAHSVLQRSASIHGSRSTPAGGTGTAA